MLLSCEKADISDLDAEILQEMENHGIPSIVACMVDREGVLWTGNYGYANTGEGIPATNQTIYSIQSISKLFLAITVFQLREQGLIDLHRDINDYLPFAVRNPNYPDAVISSYMLLNHSSSLAWPAPNEDLPDFHQFYTHEPPPLLIDWLPEYIFPDGENYRSFVWKDYPPGEKFLYSNIATSLLALVVEQISGMDYRDYCRAHILDPLEMDHSSFYLNELDYTHIATPYYNANSPMWFYTSRHYPAGFLNCSLNDFALFARACLNYGSFKDGQILSDTSFRKMLEIENPIKGVSNLWDHYFGDAVGHIGGGTGFASSATWYMEQGRAIFIFSNRYLNHVYPEGRIYGLVHLKCKGL